MQRVVVGCLCLMLVIVGFGAGAVSGSDEEKLCIPVGEITIKAPESVEAKRSEVSFPHSVHFVYNCQECHHLWEGDEYLNGCMTEGCHDLDAAPERSASGKIDKDDAVMYYKTAYHDKCIGCHKTIKEDNQKMVAAGKLSSSRLPAAGPTGCVGCHPRE